VALAHYTLTAEAMDFTRRKVLRHETEARQWRERADKLRAMNSSITTQQALRASRGSSFIVCSLETLPGQPCKDYRMLLAFMQAQQANPARQLSLALCKPVTLPAVGARTTGWGLHPVRG